MADLSTNRKFEVIKPGNIKWFNLLCRAGLHKYRVSSYEDRYGIKRWDCKIHCRTPKYNPHEFHYVFEGRAECVLCGEEMAFKRLLTHFNAFTAVERWREGLFKSKYYLKDWMWR